MTMCIAGGDGELNIASLMTSSVVLNNDLGDGWKGRGRVRRCQE